MQFNKIQNSSFPIYICDAIWENPSDVALGRFQEIRKIGRMSFCFVKIRFS